MNLSMLMSVYLGDSLVEFKTAIESVTDKQRLKIDEIVIVVDGPVNKDIALFLDKLEYDFGGQLKVKRLARNYGLAHALNLGLGECTHEWVLRMDSDDVSYPDRVQKTAEMIRRNPTAAIIGFSYDLFDSDPSEVYGMRVCPESVSNKVGNPFFRTPINHPTIVLNKQLIMDVGGYPENVGRFEDWGLALRCIQAGLRIVNSADCVLAFRAPKKIMLRRGGLRYALEELRALVQMFKLGLLPLIFVILNMMLRFPVRVMPLPIRSLVYRKLIWRQ